MAFSPQFTEADVKELAAPDSFTRGRQYLRSGQVLSLLLRGSRLQAEVQGSGYEPYVVTADLTGGKLGAVVCTCPYALGGACKHVVAALLAFLNAPDEVEEQPPIESLLAGLDRDQLTSILVSLADGEPALAERIELHALKLGHTALASAAPGALPPPPTPEVFRKRISAAFRSTRRRSHDDYHEYPDQVGEALSAVTGLVEEAVPYLQAGDARSALQVLDAVAAAYLDRFDEFGETDWDFMAPFQRIGVLAAEALLTARLTPEETEAWTERIETWQSELDEYDDEGALAAAELAARMGWEDPALQRVLQGGSGRVWEDEKPYGADILMAAWLAILERQGRTEEYLRLSHAEGPRLQHAVMLVRLDRAAEAVAYGAEHLASTGDVLRLAQTLHECGAVAEALQAAGGGLELPAEEGWRGGRRVELACWTRDRAAEAGDLNLALRAAREAQQDAPSLENYLAVQRLAGEQWPALREGLLEALRTAPRYYSKPQVDIFLHEGLVDDAVQAVSQSSDALLTARVVEAASESHPDWVIRTCRARAEAIMDEGKAGAYEDAAEWLARSRPAYVAGRASEWNQYLGGLIEKHARKYKLVPLLKALRD